MRHPPERSTLANGYFKTTFQDESQFIVESIVTDLAEMALFARTGTLPEDRAVSVRVVERPDSTFRAPIYDLEITSGREAPPLKMVLPVSQPIWSPEVYLGVARQLLSDLRRNQTATGKPEDLSLLRPLHDASAVTIERENQVLSAQLQKDFKNPALHAKAAVLLGAFAWREFSGRFFYDIRLPLCRLTAHLTFARALGGEPDIHTRLADAMLETHMNRQVAALEKLATLPADEPACAVWARVLKAANTGDYRELAAVKAPSRLERIAWFGAWSWGVDVDLAWDDLSRQELTEDPLFCRIANSASYSVETGHDLYRLSLPLELREISAVYKIARGGDLDQKKLVEEPTRCRNDASHKSARVRPTSGSLTGDNGPCIFSATFATPSGRILHS